MTESESLSNEREQAPLLCDPFALIGVVHLGALPGSPRNTESLEALEEHALIEADLLMRAGFSGVIVENFGDVPFFPDRVEPHVVAAMTRIVTSIVQWSLDQDEKQTPFRVGVNVLRNDAIAAMAIASMAGADFIRVNIHSGTMVTDQGIVTGEAHKTLRYRQQLGSEVKILADIHVKHAVPLGNWDIVSSAKDTWERGCVDGLIVTGKGTGQPVTSSDLSSVIEAVPEAPILVGSGLTLEQLPKIFGHARGAIVGTALKVDGKVTRDMDEERVALWAQTYQALVSAHQKA